jgi:hypothetical protein
MRFKGTFHIENIDITADRLTSISGNHVAEMGYDVNVSGIFMYSKEDVRIKCAEFVFSANTIHEADAIVRSFKVHTPFELVIGEEDANESTT